MIIISSNSSNVHFGKEIVFYKSWSQRISKFAKYASPILQKYKILKIKQSEESLWYSLLIQKFSMVLEKWWTGALDALFHSETQLILIITGVIKWWFCGMSNPCFVAATIVILLKKHAKSDVKGNKCTWLAYHLFVVYL